MRPLFCGPRYSVLLALLVAIVAQAQTAPQRRVLMWKVTSPTTTLYIVGSVHITDPSAYPLPKPLEDAFAASQVLVVEVDTKRMDEAATVSLMQAKAMYSDGSTLSQHISKPTSDALDVFCREQEVPRFTFEPMKIWMAAVFAAALPEIKMGADPKLRIDKHFMDEVRPPQRIEQLETPESQVDRLGAGTDAEQDQFLANSLKQAPQTLEIAARMQKAFFDGDAEGLQKIIDESRLGPDTMIKRLVDDRTAAMTAQIESYLKGKEQVFVAVGAPHVVGPKGIVQKLRDRKYKVEQLAAQ